MIGGNRTGHVVRERRAGQEASPSDPSRERRASAADVNVFTSALPRTSSGVFDAGARGSNLGRE